MKMYTPEDMEIIHQEVMRLQAEAKQSGYVPPPKEKCSDIDAIERKADWIALGILSAVIFLPLTYLFVFLDATERANIDISSFNETYYLLLPILGFLSIIFLILFIKSLESCNQMVRDSLRKAFIACLIAWFCTVLMIDSNDRYIQQEKTATEN